MSTMDKEKKLGITYILIGVLVPLLVLPFISGFSKDKSFYDNFYGAGIELSKDETEIISSSNKDKDTPKGITLEFSRLKPKRIPYRFFFVITLIFLYLGIVRIDSARRNTDGKESKE